MENMGLQDTRVFPLMVLKDITNNFSEERVIGRGGSGVVYKGVFDNGEVIAVKRLNNQYDSSGEKLGNGEAQFHNELMNLIGVKHQNIIRLVGYCYEVQNIVTEYDGKRVFASIEERVLCLEYLQGGSLKNHLSDESCGLKWHSRYKILEGICEGLKYLHTGSKKPIYHLDLKPENIFLDGNMIPKIGDFGISRLPAGSMQTCVTQNISGTLGYMPPEYVHRKEISQKFDIFSLGVIMIHIIAGHEGNQEHPYMPPQEFIERVYENWGKHLQPTKSSHSLEQVRTCTGIALRCMEFHREKRPTITEIVDELNKIDTDENSAIGRQFKNTKEEDLRSHTKQPEKGEQKKEKPDHLDEKMKKQVDSRYARTSRISTSVKYQAQSVDLATGAMGSLFPKLLQFVSNKYTLLSAQRKKNSVIHYLCRELEIMQGILREVAEVPRHQLDFTVKIWAKEVRDLSYEAENIVDSLLERFGAAEPDRKQKGYHHFFSEDTFCCEFFQAMDDIIGKVQDLSDTRPMYKVNNCDVADRVVIDPRLRTSIYKDPKEMIGIEVSVNEVLRKLTLVDGRGQQRKQTVSIFGMAGLGKTTLARAVYDRVRERFDCSVWVSVSQNPDIKKVFMAILIQIGKQKYMHTNAENFDARMLMDELRIQLANKRYLVVIDDIWDVRSWEIIKTVLVDMRNGSNVVTTTRNFQVAEKAGNVYKLQTISRQHSAELFNTRLFGGKGKVPTNPMDIPEKVLQKCAGVPLALITMASLLSKIPRYDWPKVYNSVGFGHGGNNEDVEDTRKILLLSYNDLPYYLRTCLLYLNMFPENYSLRKETLIWMWVAEGFVHDKRQIGLFKLGERYFDELVNRSFILPIVDSSRCIINGCRIHDLVLDMISFVSAGEDFVTVIDGSKQHKRMEGMAHRLTIRDTAAEQHNPLAMERTEHLRSFNTIKCRFGMMLSLSRFKALRVLSLEDCTFVEYHPYDLEHLGKLLHLRYLGLYNTPIHELPNEVGDLYSLQTLDLRGTMVKVLPFRVGRLSQLKCLQADENTRVPDWLVNLISLEKLQLDGVIKSVKFVKELGKLCELRELELSIEGLDGSANNALVESLRHLRKIQVLRLMIGVPDSSDAGCWDSYLPPPQLRELSLNIGFYGLPKWIHAFRVPNLSHLSVDMRALHEDDVDNLGYLPELVSLQLQVPSDILLNIKGYGQFPKLRCLDTSAPFKFLLGAMPALEFLHFKLDVWALKRAGFALGNLASLKNLLRLQSVRVKMNSRGARGVHVSEAKDALKSTVDNHPNNPILGVKIQYT